MTEGYTRGVYRRGRQGNHEGCVYGSRGWRVGGRATTRVAPTGRWGGGNLWGQVSFGGLGGYEGREGVFMMVATYFLVWHNPKLTFAWPIGEVRKGIRGGPPWILNPDTPKSKNGFE